MSIKHIEFLKVKPSKFLVVEVRPVRCVIETPAGPTRTTKWMNYGHWKELRGLLSGVVSEYEDHKTSLKVTQDVECDCPATKNGTSIKIGYMFTKYRRCSCYYLTPRKEEVWTDDEDESNLKLRDGGGRYCSLQPCGEMLVVSVSLLEGCEPRQQVVDGTNLDISLSKTRARATSTRFLDRQLIKTLDSTLPFTNTISDYFESSQSLGDQTDHTHKALKQVVSKSKKSQRKRKEPPSSPQTSSSENSNPNKRQDVQSSQSVDASTYYMNGDQSCNSLMENSDNSSTIFPIIRSVSSSYRKTSSFKKLSDIEGSQELNNSSFSYPINSIESSFQWDSQAQSVSSPSPPPSPVLGMSRRIQTWECQSDLSFFLRQVDSTEEMREREVSGCQNPPHEENERDYDMELRLESSLGFTDSLPDLESEQLAESPSKSESESESGQKNGAVFKDSETETAERKKKKLQALFGDSEESEYVVVNNFEENKCVPGSYVEEEYIPLHVIRRSKRRRKSTDLFGSSSVSDSEPGHSELNNTKKGEICFTITSDDMASTSTSHLLENKSRIELKKCDATHTVVMRGSNWKIHSESPTKQSMKSPEEMEKSKKMSHSKENGEKMNGNASKKTSNKKETCGKKDGKTSKKTSNKKEFFEKKDGKASKKTSNKKEFFEKKDEKASNKTSNHKAMGEKKKDGEANGQCVVQKLSNRENKKQFNCKNTKTKIKTKACTVSANQPKVSDWLTPNTSKYFSNGKNVKKDIYKASELDNDNEMGKDFVGQDSSDEAFTSDRKMSKKRKPKDKSKANTDESSSIETKSPAKRAKRLSSVKVCSTCHHSKKIERNPKKPKVDGEYSVSSLDNGNIEPLMIDTILKCSPPHLRIERGSQEASNSDRSKDAAFEGLVRGFQRLQNMTQDDLQNRLDQDGPYFRRIFCGREPNERHQMFIDGDRHLSVIGDELIYGPYSENQIMIVHDYISEKFSDIAKKIKNVYQFEDYIWKVMTPTFLVKIVMDNESVNQEEAERILVKYSLDRSINGSRSPSPF